jgi:hypothetical protein
MVQKFSPESMKFELALTLATRYAKISTPSAVLHKELFFQINSGFSKDAA